MKVIPPLRITAARLTSNSASAEPAPGEIAWSATEVVGRGERRIIGAPSATVTISNASPAVVTWAGNNLAENCEVVLSTSGGLPAGLTAGTVYYVRDRLSADTFTLATEPFGAAISTTSAGTGTHTATAHVHRVYEALQGSKATVTISQATPGVISWAAHSLSADDPVVFNTTGALPSPLAAGTIYYVLSGSTLQGGSFTVAASPGGAAINTTTPGSGTHTCGLAVNYNKPPLLNSDVWGDAGPTNAWAMFDSLRNTVTYGDSPMTVVITPGERCDAIGLAGLDADTVQVTVTSGATQVYDSESQSLAVRPVRDWYEYFFKKFAYKTATSFFDLPPYTDAVITITLTRSTGKVGLGAVVLGMQADMGEARPGPNVAKLNFTTVERDRWGRATVTKIASKPQVMLDLWIKKDNLDAFREVEDAIDGEVCFWAGVSDTDDGFYQSLQVLGFYRRINKTLAPNNVPNYVIANIELEEI